MKRQVFYYHNTKEIKDLPQAAKFFFNKYAKASDAVDFTVLYRVKIKGVCDELHFALRNEKALADLANIFDKSRIKYIRKEYAIIADVNEFKNENLITIAKLKGF